MTTYEKRLTAFSVGPPDEPLFSEMATTVRIDDESGGEFVAVEQHGRTDVGKICINPEEWPVLRETIDELITLCRDA